MGTTTTTNGKLLTSYQRLVSSGKIESDPAQLELIALLDRLLEKISSKRLSSKSSSLGWLFSKNQRSAAKQIKGLYVWGGVGRGKSMLMDMFHEFVPHKRKRRAHFNDFMQDAQERIHKHREAFKRGETKEEDPIPVIGKKLAEESRVLCFDEFTVTDIADAMILGRLFDTLFQEGVTIVATSNVQPERLYYNGLNRKVFLPFIKLLQENVDVYELGARTDYRLEKLDKAPVYHQPLNQKTEEAVQEIWKRLTGVETGQPLQIELKGRILELPEFVRGVARTSFSSLCEEARSAEDYLALARQVHTLFIKDIPVINKENRNVAKRFILLIDTLYDNHVRTIISAEDKPENLYLATAGTEAFEYDRTVSRLNEMQSREYLGAGM
ncbi:MAG: cell division protein ZapE [Pseudomonadota bacterium]